MGCNLETVAAFVYFVGAPILNKVDKDVYIKMVNGSGLAMIRDRIYVLLKSLKYDVFFVSLKIDNMFF